MIFSVIILLLLLAVAYFHFAQGLFSATISAFLVVLSAVFAVAYHETVAEKLLAGRMGDSGYAICLCLLFAITYVVLRVIFDKAVPGNIRFPFLLDRVGSAVMGIVAGIFATGVFALAAQSLPFGPNVAGYAPYDLSGAQAVTVPTDQQYLDSTMFDAMKDPTLNPAKEKPPLIPVADILLGTVERLSDGGALAGDQPLAEVHPNYVTEMFGDRVGIQVGAKHTALNLPGNDQVKLGGLYALSALPAEDAELKELRGPDFKPPQKVVPGPSQLLLVARLMVQSSAADDADHLFRFSPASIRLVTNEKDYFPIGTVDSGDLLLLSRPDDFMFLDLSSSSQVGVDVAFLVDRDDLLGNSATNTKVVDGASIIVKRMARVDLSGQPILGNYAASPDVKVMRKKMLAQQIQKTPPPQVAITSAIQSTASATPARRTSSYGGATASPAAATPRYAPAASPAPPSARSALAGAVGAATGQVSGDISLKVGVNTSDGEAQNVSVAGGTVSLKDSRIAVANIEPTVSTDKLAAGDSTISELYVPDGKQLVQVTSKPTTAMPALLDGTGTSTPASGYFGTVTTGAGQSAFLHFNYDHPLSSVAAPPAAASVTYLFVVPSGTHPTQLSINGAAVPVTIAGK